MRRAIKDKLSGFRDDPRSSSASSHSSANNPERRNVADRVVGFVMDKGDSWVSAVQEHVASVTDTTGTLAKQKLLQTLFASGVIRSEHIRKALQIGIGYFLEQKYRYPNQPPSQYVQREKFAGAGGATPPHSLPDFDIEAYGLDKFTVLMNIYGINPSTLQQHICQGELKEIVNPSSSGSLLYLTSDSSYLIKTIRDYDAKFIQHKFLDEYFQYVRQTPGTFLAKLFGAYGYIPYISQQRGITVDAFTLRFAIFSNIIPTNIEIHEKYDLKGSSYKRDANISERMKTSATFKDNDFRDLHPQGLKVPSQIYYHLKDILTRDVDFLEKLNIMDYSLLLVIHNVDNRIKPKRSGGLEALMGTVHDRFLTGMTEQQMQNKNNMTSQPRQLLRYRKPCETLGFIYEEIPMFDIEYAKEFGGIPAINENGERLLLFIGIIDILQTFDICKVMQRQYQSVENRDVVDERSIVEADFYARRFKEFVFTRVFQPAENSAPQYRNSYPQSNVQTRPTYSSLYPQTSFY